MVVVLPQLKRKEDRIFLIDHAITVATVGLFVKLGEGDVNYNGRLCVNSVNEWPRTVFAEISVGVTSILIWITTDRARTTWQTKLNAFVWCWCRRWRRPT